MAKVEQLTTYINTQFYEHEYSRSILVNNSLFKKSSSIQEKEDAIDGICKKIAEKTPNIVSLQNDKRFLHIAFSDYMEFKRSEQDSFIFRIDNNNGRYTISTGLYCGVINLGKEFPKLVIQTGYSDTFFTRILNFCCGIYADQNTEKGVTESESIYSLLIQYLYLISLRKVIYKTIPKKYVCVTERGYEVNGDIDIESFVNHDILAFDKKLTYKYHKHLEIQLIIDVIFTALKCCKIKDMGTVLPNLISFRSHLNGLYSGKRLSREELERVDKEKCLTNSLYSDFKKPIEYAKILIKHSDLNIGGAKSTEGLSGFLVDASFLWEMYLYNLLKLHLKNWDIVSQAEISFYSDTFFSKQNYPDFILRNKDNGSVFILDAKFKRMMYENIDVDNEDIRQLHSYSFYYLLREKEKFRGAALIYPSKINKPDNVNNVDNFFGIKSVDYKFGVFSIKDPSGSEPTMHESESKFIQSLRDFLGD